MAFYHQDGIVPAWNFAKRYSGPDGRIATLPDVIEARLATEPGDLPWQRYFTTNTAEYFGQGADGRKKLIVAHGVGPMSTIEGIKDAYSWEYKDKERNRRGGRISADEFLKLEAGEYGTATVLTSGLQFLRLDPEEQYPVFVVDFMDYVESVGEYVFHRHVAFSEALFDLLLLVRLGPKGPRYLADHQRHAFVWHAEQRVPLPGIRPPYIIFNKGASNCSYVTVEKVSGKYDWSHPQPSQLEEGKAMAHLIRIGRLEHTRTSDYLARWEGLTCDVSCHEWSNGVRLLAVPKDTHWNGGIKEAPDPGRVLRQRWQELMRPVAAGSYVPPRLYHLEQSGNEWFTHYPKPSDGARMDEGDIEFHVRSLSPVGEKGVFKVDGDFFLRYHLSQVVALAPAGANAYNITDISYKDGAGLTTVTVQFYAADIDTSQRLPRVREIKQNYDLLMG
jgi:hypothetical protein